jgi:Family of unknown function (DUF5681)
MSRHKTKESTGSGSDSYSVGYGKPPLHSRFRAGQSGNPAGRRKGVCNLMTDVRRTLNTPIKVKERGRTRKKSTQEGALMVLREKALRGDARALDRLLDLAQRFNNDVVETGPAQPLGADDQAILDAYVAQFSAAAMSSPTAEPSAEPAAKRRDDSNKKVSK